MKRLLSLLLVVCLVFGLAAQAIAATLTPSVNPTEVQAGDQVVVTLTLDEAVTGLNNLDYKLYYNADVFGDPTGAPLSGNTALQMSIPKTDANGTYVSVSYVDTASEGSGSFAAGPFYQVTFTAKETVTAVTESSFQLVLKTVADTSWQNPGLSADSTSITVTVKPQAVPATSVILSAETLTLTVDGEAATLTATVAPENATDSVVWSVAPEGVVTVENGVVIPVAAGTATITATAGSVRAACAVTVEAAQAECDHAETEKETSYTAGETAGTHVKTVTCKACSQTVDGPVTETCVGTEANPHLCVCGAACNRVPVLKEGVEPTKTVVIQTGHSYQLHDVTNGNIFMDPDGDELTYASYFFRKSTDGHTWGDWETFHALEHGGINDSVVNGTEGTYYYEFRAHDGIGYSEQTWTLVLDTRNEVPANVKFYLGQDHNYKTNGNIMPALELYKTAGIDENLFDYVGWFIKNGETVYVYDPHDYAITDGATDYVTVDGQQYELFGYEKVSFSDSLFGAAPAEGETATASGTVADGYNMFYVTVSTGRYSTRVYGYNTETEAYDVYLGGQSMELPMEVDIYGNGGNDIYLRQVDVYTTSKKLDSNYFTAEDYYAEVIMPVTGSMIHSGDPYVSGNYTRFPFFSWAAGNGSLYNTYVYPYDTENYIFSQVINNNTPAGTSVVTKTLTISAAKTFRAKVPANADFGLYFQYNNFNTKEVAPEDIVVNNGDGTKTLSFKVTKGSGNYTWRLSDPNGNYVTKAGWLKGIAETTEKAFTFSAYTNKKSHDFSNLGTAVKSRDEADLQVFLSHSGFKSVAEKTRIRAYRMWQLINTDSANIMMDADFNVQLLQGNETDISLVSGGNAANNWIDVTPTTTDIVAVNYDALDVYTTSDDYGSHGGFFPATNPERTNVFVITNETAGTAAAYIPFNGSKDTDRGTKWDYNYDTWFYLNRDAAPKLDFTVTGGSDLQVSYATVITDASLNSTLSGWTTLTEEDGVYYADLSPFRTANTKGGTVIIKMTDSTGTSYELVRVAEMQIDVTNASHPGEAIMPGDDVTVTFDGLYRSVNKISGIFNPVTYRLRYYAGEKLFESAIAQYQQMDTTKLTLTIPEEITFPDDQTKTEYRFTNGHIDGGMYSASYPFDAMYYITDTGVGTNFSAVNTAFVLSRFADIPIEVTEKVYYNVKLNVTDGTNALTGYTLTLTDQEGNPVTAQEDGSFRLGFGTYQYSVAKAGYVAKAGSFSLSSATQGQLVEGIFSVSIVLLKAAANAWDGATATEPAKDESDVYQIGTGAELAWFAKAVNGGSADIKGELTADIDLAGYNWTPIGSKDKNFKGTFDGKDHQIYNLSIINKAYASNTGAGLFGYGAGCTIQNLTVMGEIELTNSASVGNGYVGGVMGSATGTVTMTNVHADVDITITRVKGNWARVGGLVGSGATLNLTNCSNTGNVSGYQYVGGIAGNATGGTISQCCNAGAINADTYAGGIVGNHAGGSTIACYNVGAVTTAGNYAGGIAAGFSTGKLTNCYNAGNVTAKDTVGGIVGNISNKAATVTKNYYLEGTCGQAFGKLADGMASAPEGVAMTESAMTMPSFVQTMNTGLETAAYKEGTTYPILVWENAAGYYVSFVDEDGTVLQSGIVNVGETPVYTGITPTKAPTVDKVFTFSGWEPEITAVSGRAVYRAVYTGSARPYTVRFVNDNGDVLQSGGEDYGKIPAYTGATPTKAADAQYTYTFAGWSPTISAVTGDATYTATYTSALREYEVTLPTGEGCTVNGVDKVTYGSDYSFKVAVAEHYDGSNMVVKANGTVVTANNGTYTVTNVTGDLTITVSGVEKLHNVTVSVKNSDGTAAVGLTVKLVKGNVEEASTNENNNGEYTLEDVHEGTYNLVAEETGNGRTMTVKVEVMAASGDTMTVEPVTMPEANVSSKLEVSNDAASDDAPAIVVGGLDALASANQAETEEGQEQAHVEVSMTVTKQNKDTADTDTKEEITNIEAAMGDDSDRTTTFLTIDLSKTVEGENGSEAITDTGDVLLEIIVPYDVETVKSVKVFRYHDGKVDELTKTPNADGEYIELRAEKGEIAIFAKKFSTYAISTSETEDAPVEPEKPKIYRVSVIDGTGSGDYEAGKTVQIQAVIPNGYRFKQWVVIPNTVKLASTTSAATTFVMPETTVTILAEFEKIEASQKKEETVKKMSFTDVKTSDWFYDEVKYIYEAGIMTGLSATKFGPNQTTTRGMIVTMLYRLEGSPKVEGMSTFSDVNPNAYFADAIKWAAKNKIVEGYDGKFAPNDAITREQMATILYRYCKYKGYDVSAKGDLSVFADAAQISDYAKDAMAWAVGIGLYNGRGDGTIVAPRDNATRAEVAAILMRFMERKK